MSERNGDRARYQKNRKRKLLHRQRLRALLTVDKTGGRTARPAAQRGDKT